MSQQHKIGSHKTSVFTDSNGFVNVVYHSTPVIQFNLEKRLVYLNSGGYRTATTKTRINQACNQFNLPISVYQKNFEWYIRNDSKDYTMPFKDGTVVRF